MLQVMSSKTTAAMFVALVLSMLAGVASATPTGVDFSSILAGLNGDTAVIAVVAAAAIIAGIGFAIWAGKRVARFFG